MKIIILILIGCAAAALAQSKGKIEKEILQPWDRLARHNITVSANTGAGGFTTENMYFSKTVEVLLSPVGSNSNPATVELFLLIKRDGFVPLLRRVGRQQFRSWRRPIHVRSRPGRNRLSWRRHQRLARSSGPRRTSHRLRRIIRPKRRDRQKTGFAVKYARSKMAKEVIATKDAQPPLAETLFPGRNLLMISEVAKARSAGRDMKSIAQKPKRPQSGERLVVDFP